MPNRLIRPGILTSPRVNALSFGAEVFYRRLMSAADDYGCFDADWRVLRAQLYPMRLEEIGQEQIETWIEECSRLLPGEDEPLVRVYYVGRKRYLEITNFGQRLRRAKSKFPSRDGGEREGSSSVSQTNDRHSPSSAAHAQTTPTPLSPPTPPPTPTPTPTPTPAAASETDSQFEAIVEAYPDGGRGELRAARKVFDAVLANESIVKRVPRDEVFLDILDAVVRWKKTDYRWLAGKVHGLRRFLADRLWLENPQPVAHANGHPKPPPTSRAAENLERLRKFSLKSEEERKAHAHT